MKKNINLNWVDRTLGFFSPKVGYERASWRSALVRNYDSGNSGRSNSGWKVVNQPAEQSNQGQRDTIRARARDLERNSDIAEAIIGNLERNIVGTGIQLQARVLDTKGEENETLNQEIETLWKKWCKARNCDITEQLSFAEMQAMAIRRKQVDGGILFIKSYLQDKKIPFVLQIREVDDIDSTYNLYNSTGKNRVINGIELDEYNKPLAYWLKTITPDGMTNGKSVSVSSDRVIFLYRKQRPSQIREISQLARTAGRIRDINEFVEAVSVKERILACLSVFIKKITPAAFSGRNGAVSETTESAYPAKTISPGMIDYLQPGEDIQTVSPSGQASNAKEFITTQQRLAGSGQGLSYEAASRDMSQVNYSSARQGHLEDRRTYGMEQQYLVEHLCSEVYTEFIISAVLSGELKIPDFWKNKENYLRHEWITPGWSWIDPLKEVKANETALDTCQTTLSELCSSNGKDWRDVLKQRAKEIKLTEELQINLGVNSNAKTNTAVTGDNSTKKP